VIALLTKIRKLSAWLIKNHLGKTIIGVLILWVIGIGLIGNWAIRRFQNQKININPDGIHITKAQAEKQAKVSQSQEAEIITKIIINNENNDSLYAVLDSIHHRKVSKLDTLQSWYNNYRLHNRRNNPN
jgi:predicted negative regulator of RcsB-dependent stress response